MSGTPPGTNTGQKGLAMRFELWHGTDAGDQNVLGKFESEGEVQKSGAILAKLLPANQHVFYTALDLDEPENQEGLYTLEFLNGEWVDTAPDDL